MYICHKCAGVLKYDAKTESTVDLSGCTCISGYYRGFEPLLTREDVIKAQIEQAYERIVLYTRQKRKSDWIQAEQDKISKLGLLR